MNRYDTGRIFRIALLSLIAVTFVAPLYFLISTSFQRVGSIFLWPPPLIPYVPTLKNYAELLSPELPRALFNSLWMGAIVTVGSLFVIASAAYTMSVNRIRWAMTLFLVGLLIPPATLFIPLYVTVNRFYHFPEWLAAISPQLFSAAGIAIFKAYFDTVPRELIEAARMDGASEWQITRHAILPIAKPIVMYYIIGTVAGFLMNYLWQMMTLQTIESQTFLIVLARRAYRRAYAGLSIGRLFSMGTVLLVPILIMYFFFNKHIVNAKLSVDLEEK